MTVRRAIESAKSIPVKTHAGTLSSRLMESARLAIVVLMASMMMRSAAMMSTRRKLSTRVLIVRQNRPLMGRTFQTWFRANLIWLKRPVAPMMVIEMPTSEPVTPFLAAFFSRDSANCRLSKPMKSPMRERSWVRASSEP